MPRNTVTTTVSRDADLVQLLKGRADYPGPSALLDQADRAWARSVGLDVPERVETPPLHELARAARRERAWRKSTHQKKHT
jgi:hypothetical protein